MYLPISVSLTETAVPLQLAAGKGGDLFLASEKVRKIAK